MVVVAICFAVAALSAKLGLSLALGAFLAGLIISESEYGHHSLGLVMPFRNLLVSFFFVSIGMLLDPGTLAKYWWMVLLGAIGLMLAKTVTGTIAVQALRYPLRVSLGTGLALSQVGSSPSSWPPWPRASRFSPRTCVRGSWLSPSSPWR